MTGYNLWHRRLGHTPNRFIKSTIEKKSICFIQTANWQRTGTSCASWKRPGSNPGPWAPKLSVLPTALPPRSNQQLNIQSDWRSNFEHQWVIIFYLRYMKEDKICGHHMCPHPVWLESPNWMIIQHQLKRADLPSKKVTLDIFSSFVNSIEGYNYAPVLTDDCAEYRWEYGLKTKEWGCAAAAEWVKGTNFFFFVLL